MEGPLAVLWLMRVLLLLFWLSVAGASAQPIGRITDVVLVLEGPATPPGTEVNLALYGPETAVYTYPDGRTGFAYDTLRQVLERHLAAALDLNLRPTRITANRYEAVPGPALTPPPGVQGGHPRSFRLQGLPDQEDPAEAFRAEPDLDYAILLYARAYRVLGRGAKDITNKQQQEFYDLDLRLCLVNRAGNLLLDKRVDGVRWDGQKFSVKIMGRRTTDTSITGNELVALLDKALAQVLKGVRRRDG